MCAWADYEEPPAPLANEDDVARVAYSRLAAAAAADADASKRVALVSSNGFGNQHRMAIAALTLGLATGRVVALTRGRSGADSVYPAVYADPFPLWRAHVPRRRRDVEIGTDADAGPFACLLEHGNETADAALRACGLADPPTLVVAGSTSWVARWRRVHGVQSALAARFAPVCAALWRGVDGTRPGVAAASLLGRVAGPPPAPALEALGAADRAALEELSPRGCVARTLLRLPTLLSSALRARPRSRFTARLEATRTALAWSAARVRVGLQLRHYADLSLRASRDALDGAHACVRRVVAAAFAARGLPPASPPSDALVFLATDRPELRSVTAAALADVARVVWAPNATAYVHSVYGSQGDRGALEGVLVDWTLLGDADALVVTHQSSFGATAAAARPGGTPVTSVRLVVGYTGGLRLPAAGRGPRDGDCGPVRSVWP